MLRKKVGLTEAELLKGELRIDIPTLKEMIAPPEAIMLKAVDDGGQIAGCVYLQVQERGLYLGLLTVSPVLQASGIGKKLLSAAEDFAKDHHCSSIFMQVISIRSDLVAWYERHGYRNTAKENHSLMITNLVCPRCLWNSQFSRKISGENYEWLFVCQPIA